MRLPLFRGTGLVLTSLILTGGGANVAWQEASPSPPRFDVDTGIRPQDDLFAHVNGRWLASTTMPPEKVFWGTMIELGDKAEGDLRTIIEEAASTAKPRRGSLAQQAGDLYSSMMDEARIESLGLTPIRPQLERIYAARTASEFAAEAGRIASVGGGGPFEGMVDSDRPGGELFVHLSQSGILLPDRDYYLEDRYERFRAGYVDYLSRIFTLAGRPEARQDALAVLALETELARAQWSQIESRDPLKTANRVAYSDLDRVFPGFDWHEWAKPQGIDRVRTVVIAQPSFFRRFAELATSTPLETWKAWLAARCLTAAAPFISESVADARFDFFGRELSGQERPRARWRRAVALVSGYLGDAVGRLYVQKHFPPASKARAERLVANVVASFGEAVRQSDWMRPATKRRALQKLSQLSTKIGYPSRWRDYSGLEIKAGDLFGNIQRARQFQSAEHLAVQRSVSLRDRWAVSPQTVTAYYSPGLNELVVTAAMLQPPLFDPLADDAVNYGAIGAIIGHEISHGFDDRGRFYGGRGEVRDWWTAQDEAAFARRAQLLVEQFDEYAPAPGLKVDGRLTLGENIGDLAGLSIAYRAYKRSLRGKASAVFDGQTGEQRFFLSWAAAWRGRMRDEYLQQWLLSSPYAPSRYRANGPASNLDGFYDAFGVREGDRMFRRPEERVQIW